MLSDAGLRVARLSDGNGGWMGGMFKPCSHDKPRSLADMPMASAAIAERRRLILFAIRGTSSPSELEEDDSTRIGMGEKQMARESDAEVAATERARHQTE